MADYARVLSHSRLFYGMPSASLVDLISHGRIERIHGTQLVPANELRIVLEGDLRTEAEGTVLGRGNFIGETALMDLALPLFEDDREAIRVHSQSGCTCLVITPHAVNTWMERHPQLQAALYQHLSQELFNRSLKKAA